VTAPLTFFSPCPRGLEAALAQELRELGADVLSPVPGGVQFAGDGPLGLRVNLHSRLASRVLQQVQQGFYRHEDDLYRLALETEWERWHAPLASLRVDTHAQSSPLRSLNFATLRVKDGVVDRQRTQSGERPSVERHSPERRIVVFLEAQRCTLYLDWSGESLFKRGWRRDGFDAPLKEHLAAGLLHLSGWQPDTPLLDPFCGSGTILIEAATWAAGLPPGARRRFAFEHRRDFDRRVWDSMRRFTPRTAPTTPLLFGSDVSEAALAAARANLGRAGIDLSWIQWQQLDALHRQKAPAPSGIVLSNPPYGERLDVKGRQSLAMAERFWPAYATQLKQQFTGWRTCLFTSDLEVPKRLRLKPARRTPLFNGALECRLFCFEIVAGSHRRNRPDAITPNPNAPLRD
jgi:putative N6-adenine-specific DNA methylase